jgi:hypothetical protein
MTKWQPSCAGTSHTARNPAHVLASARAWERPRAHQACRELDRNVQKVETHCSARPLRRCTSGEARVCQIGSPQHGRRRGPTGWRRTERSSARCVHSGGSRAKSA